MSNHIKKLPVKQGQMEIGQKQGRLALEIDREIEIEGIGMGVFNDGTPFLNQRGLARLCGVENAHIGAISSQWHDKKQKPRIKTVKEILARAGTPYQTAHVEAQHRGIAYYCYPADVCLAILEYYAFDAGANCQRQARDNFRLLAGSKLRELIYSYVGYDPTQLHAQRFANWHDRIALNYQSAPKGYFHLFNEAHTVIYELIQAGAEIGKHFVVDISMGWHWAKYWADNDLDQAYGGRCRYPHRYPDSHPQAKSNPHDSWCYPLASLGEYRQWLQNTYVEGGKFSAYLEGKVTRGELPPSIAQLAIEALVPAQVEGPRAEVAVFASVSGSFCRRRAGARRLRGSRARIAR
jgi:hypothetical protein